jgi:hypothetical protein
MSMVWSMLLKSGLLSTSYFLLSPRVSNIFGALTNTKKLDMTTQQYITKMKGFDSELATAKDC